MAGKSRINVSEVVDLYSRLHRCDQVASIIGCHPATVSRILKQQGIEVLRHSFRDRPPSRQYDVNEDRFSGIDADCFYFLGFLACDGYVTKNRNSDIFGLSVAEKDRDIVYKLRDFLGTTKPVSHHSYVSRKSTVCNPHQVYHIARLAIFSSKMCKDLGKWGICPRKTRTLRIKKQIPKAFVKDFLRGCVDADGSINVKGQSCYVSSVSKKFLRQLSKLCVEGIDVLPTFHDNGQGVCIMQVAGRHRCTKFLSWLYGDAGVFLDRKKRLADKLIKV